MITKHSVHAYVASVYFKGGGEPRDIHCDNVVPNRHGFTFVREDGTCEYLSAAVVDSFEMFKAAPVGGTA